MSFKDRYSATYMRFDQGPPQPPPAKDLPKRWLPWPLTQGIKLLFLPFITLDLAIQRFIALFFPPPILRTGSCKKRGHCCYYILMPQFSSRFLSSLLNFWMTQVQGFYSRKKIVMDAHKKTWKVMGCSYLQKDGSCGQYFLRPLICRTWPSIQGFSEPQFLKGCGFKPLFKDTRLIKKWQQNPSNDALKMFPDPENR